MPERPVISIVDDDMSVREALGGLVNAFGFDAAEFSSAVEFLRSGRVPDTSCLIADMQMPGMNGLELQAELVAKGRPIPIIFVTAFPDARTPCAGLGSRGGGFSWQTPRPRRSARAHPFCTETPDERNQLENATRPC
jgi:CheY-like chemotaxis protein